MSALIALGIIMLVSYFIAKIISCKKPRPPYLIKSPLILILIMVVSLIMTPLCANPDYGSVVALWFLLGILSSVNYGLYTTFKNDMADIENFANTPNGSSHSDQSNNDDDGPGPQFI